MNILCFDVGGTSVKYGLLNEKAEILEKGSFPSQKDSMEPFLQGIQEVYASYEDKIEGVSFSMPGIIDPDTGYFHTGGAFDSFIHEVNMKEVFSSFIHKPVIITNDAKCAAYGELGYGCLKDVKDAVVIVLGTGIGGCLIKDRKPIYGKHLMAGEFSFVNIASSHDPEDTFALRCGAKALNERVQKELESEEELNGHKIFEKVRDGDEKAIKALHDFCYDLAVQIYNLMVIYDPERFAIGGGISNQSVLFEQLDLCFAQMKEEYGRLFLGKPEVVACTFKNDANLIGALYRFISEGM